jgi:hypothetical protein
MRLLHSSLLLPFLLLFCDTPDEVAPPAEEVLGIATDDRTWGDAFFFVAVIVVPFSAVRLASSSTC